MFTYSLLGEVKEKVGEILYQLRQNVSPSYVM